LAYDHTAVSGLWLSIRQKAGASKFNGRHPKIRKAGQSQSNQQCAKTFENTNNQMFASILEKCAICNTPPRRFHRADLKSLKPMRFPKRLDSELIDGSVPNHE